MVKQDIWNEFGKNSKKADIAVTIGIGFQFLFLMSGLHRKKKNVTHDHEGLTVLRNLQQQGEVTGVESSSGMVTSHRFAVWLVRRDTGNLLGYIFH